MAIEPLSIRDMEQRTKDVYEAVAVMTQRAKQIIHERLVEEALNMESEQELTALDPMPEEKDPEDYVEQEKPTSIAINDFMNDKIKWHYDTEIEE